MIEVYLVSLVIDLVDLRGFHLEERMTMVPADDLLSVSHHLLLDVKGR